MASREELRWCPQHGYPEPCAKCNGMTKEKWEEFFRSLAEQLAQEGKDE